ncbi:MAG: 16S rRNA (cytosine(1402)-N(4))-methyltransferase RsmH, partial [Candidatus Woesebacteria bacterium]|nr:16S rRNA (cytosine(1402)-N(4))-methyltransferase RsmH [Candidatus Woesebacteria bacterium]
QIWPGRPKNISKNLVRMKNDGYHESVVVYEVIEALHLKKAHKYIDATVGNGGHALEILKAGGQVLGIDLDPKMLLIAEKRLKGIAAKNYKLVNANFIEIDGIAKDYGFNPVDGILFDLGVTNIHLKDLERGFSFGNEEAVLDMRLNSEVQGVKAYDLLNVLREDQLEDLFKITLDPGGAKWITGRVLHSRAQKPIKSVGDMLEISEGLRTGKAGLNEATLPFLALRIAVNSELTNLEEVLPKAFNLLAKGGRLVVISFHSGEDTIVKNFFKEKSKEGAEIITCKPVLAGIEEININRRARSAKMRVLQK